LSADWLNHNLLVGRPWSVHRDLLSPNHSSRKRLEAASTHEAFIAEAVGSRFYKPEFSIERRDVNKSVEFGEQRILAKKPEELRISNDESLVPKFHVANRKDRR
jgi:hypothetical protein